MDIVPRRTWTQDEFFAWAQTQDARYEFDGFEPVAMAGGSINHDRVMLALHDALRARLGPAYEGQYELLGDNTGVQTIGTAIRYPDRLITGTRGDGDRHTAADVIVVFEVTSPSTEDEDFGPKRAEYAAVPTILRYVLLDSERAHVTVSERGQGQKTWSDAAPVMDGTIRIPEIGIAIPVAEIYRGIRFSRRNATSH